MSTGATIQRRGKKPKAPPSVTVVRAPDDRGLTAPAARSIAAKVNIHSLGGPDHIAFYLDDGSTSVWRQNYHEVDPESRWLTVKDSSTNATGANWLFPSLSQYVLDLAELDIDDSEWIDPSIALRATQIIDQIALNPSAPAPQVFSHGGDAVVLTWEGGLVAKLLTITAGRLKLMVTQKGSKDRASVVIDLANIEDRHLFFQMIGAVPLSSASVDDER